MDKLTQKGITWDVDENSGKKYFSDKRAAIATSTARLKIHQNAQKKVMELLVLRGRTTNAAAREEAATYLSKTSTMKGYLVEGGRLACQIFINHPHLKLEDIHAHLKQKVIQDKKALTEAHRLTNSSIHLKHNPFASLRTLAV